MYVAASFITSRIPAQGHNITNIQGGCGDPKISELGGGAPTPPPPIFCFYDENPGVHQFNFLRAAANIVPECGGLLETADLSVCVHPLRRPDSRTTVEIFFLCLLAVFRIRIFLCGSGYGSGQKSSCGSGSGKDDFFFDFFSRFG